MSYSIVRQALESGTKCPVKGVVIDIVEFELGKSFGYRLYRSNFENYSDPDKEKIYEWLRERASFAKQISSIDIGIDISDYEDKEDG